jgi:hypothetical protein
VSAGPLAPALRWERLHRLASRRARVLQSRIDHLAIFRFVLFAALLPTAGMALLGQSRPLFAACFAIGLLLFGAAMALHDRLYAALSRTIKLKELVVENQARLALELANLPERPFAADHPFAHDCDLSGAKGLWKLIDQTYSQAAGTLLLGWLEQNDAKNAQARQQQLIAWSRRPMQPLRLLLRQRENTCPDHDACQHLQRLVEQKRPWPLHPIARTFLLVSALANLLNLLLAASGPASPVPWQAGALGQLILLTLCANSLRGLLRPALAAGPALSALRRALLELPANSLPKRIASQRNLLGSEFLAQLDRSCTLVDKLLMRRNGVVHFLSNFAYQRDLLLLHRLRSLGTDHWQQLGQHQQFLVELEALASLTLFAASLGGCWPEFLEQASPCLNARAMGHPLIPKGKRVCNDLRMEGEGSILLITGSNMSGKSTFLRTAGVNLVLARMGLPACAESFSCSLPALICSLRISDDLSSGLSTFYAEVRRLRQIVNWMEIREVPVLYLLDEILRGTNSRERFLAVQAFVRYAMGTSSMGMITTHDIELLSLAKQYPDLVQTAHFQEIFEQDQMFFDYRLRPGPLRSTNALAILEREGFPFSFLPENEPPAPS